MALQLSVTARNNRLDTFETTVGTDAKLYLRTGAQPSDCSQVDAGSLLATMSLPTDWMQGASGGQKQLNGTWSTTGSAPGDIGHFRIKDSTGTTCHMQGSVGIGTGDLQVLNTNVAVGQTVTITMFTLSDGNA